MDISNNATDNSLGRKENKYWQKIASYKKEVLPLHFRLKKLNQQKLLAPLIALWQREPALENVAQQQLNHAYDFFSKVYVEMHERERYEAPEPRKYLADKLRGISLVLGNGEIRQINPDAEWKPNWELAQLLGDAAPLYLQPLKPEAVGELLAKIDYFWQCWHDFHKAEQFNSTPALYSSLQPTTASNNAVPSSWEALLIGSLTLSELFDFFADCGLLKTSGELTTLGRGDSIIKARKAPWVGALQALMVYHQLDSNTAGICRALVDPAGRIEVTINEGTLRQPSKKADMYRIAAEKLLEERGLLRK